MLAIRALAAGAEEPGLGWLVWVLLLVFVLMVFLGWLVWSKGWLKQEEEVVHDDHAHAEHDHGHAHASESEPQPVHPAPEPEPLPVQPPVPDDLTTLEGIGPKVSKLLAGAGITTFASLAQADLGQLRELLDGAGYRYMEPAGWVAQAKLAAAGDAEGLQKLQDELKGGRFKG